MATGARDLLAQDIGDRVRERRDGLGYSMELLAGLADISKSTLVEIEQGRQVPRGDTLIALAWALGARAEDLLPSDYAPFVKGPALVAGMNRGTRAVPARGKRDQRRRTSKKGGREGGIPTMAPLPAQTREEAA